MDGRDYLDHFYRGDLRLQTGADDELFDIGAVLAKKLWVLYGGEVDGILAEDNSFNDPIFLAEFSVVGLKAAIAKAGFGSKVIYEITQRQPAYGEDIPFNPEDAGSYSDQASKLIMAERSDLSTNIAFLQDQMLSRVILKLESLSSKARIDEQKAAKIVKDIIADNRHRLANLAFPWQGLISVSYDSTLDGFYTAQSDVVVHRRPRFPVPGWLDGENPPADPVELLCSFVSEIETLIILSQWVTDNKLPYLPMLAPPQFEKGHLRDGARNPHADILLCNVTPGSGEIIPIQVKKKRNPAQAEEYIEGMKFITPSVLGLCKTENVPIKRNGIAHTGHRVTYTYGEVLNGFVELTLAGKGRKPTKAQKESYDEKVKNAYPGIEVALAA